VPNRWIAFSRAFCLVNEIVAPPVALVRASVVLVLPSRINSPIAPMTSTCCSGGRRFGHGLYLPGGIPFTHPRKFSGIFGFRALRPPATGSLDVKAVFSAE